MGDEQVSHDKMTSLDEKSYRLSFASSSVCRPRDGPGQLQPVVQRAPLTWRHESQWQQMALRGRISDGFVTVVVKMCCLQRHWAFMAIADSCSLSLSLLCAVVSMSVVVVVGIGFVGEVGVLAMVITVWVG